MQRRILPFRCRMEGILETKTGKCRDLSCAQGLPARLQGRFSAPRRASRDQPSSRADGLRCRRSEIILAALSRCPPRRHATIRVSSHSSRCAWLPPIRTTAGIRGSRIRIALSLSPSANARMPRQRSMAEGPGARRPSASRAFMSVNRLSRPSLPVAAAPNRRRSSRLPTTSC